MEAQENYNPKRTLKEVKAQLKAEKYQQAEYKCKENGEAERNAKQQRGTESAKHQPFRFHRSSPLLYRFSCWKYRWPGV